MFSRPLTAWRLRFERRDRQDHRHRDGAGSGGGEFARGTDRTFRRHAHGRAVDVFVRGRRTDFLGAWVVNGCLTLMRNLHNTYYQT